MRTLRHLTVLTVLVGAGLVGVAVAVDTTPSASAAVAPGTAPDRVVLNPGASPDSRSVTWRTAEPVTEGAVEIGTPGGPTRRVAAMRSQVVRPGRDAPAARHHTAVVDDLAAGQTYRYRVGGDGVWSPWFEFTTVTADDPWTFLYFGDAQEGLGEAWPAAAEAAFDAHPQARAQVHAGDLVNLADDDGQWGAWFAGLGPHAASSTLLSAPGNHELWGDPGMTAYLGHFGLPDNGPVGQSEGAWFADLGGVRFVSLDANSNLDGRDVTQTAWLRRTLAENPMPWTVVTFHQPMFAARADRNNAALRESWLPILEQYDVDLVLQGHDHAYARGRLDTDAATDRGPVFVVSHAGAKFYDLDTADRNNWTRNGAIREVAHDQVATWQSIRVEADRLMYRSYVAGLGPDRARTDLAVGDLADAFTVTRLPDGSTRVTDDPR
ncbi:Ser/Thr phosphatase family protein [Aeromicrobium marinum DSM 15272]|uniref:Ser/Thr phosphatase family protein n=1 Tax=Aeromicrobium marinum DSM 15272 TaxID=585531 RepID=E2SCW0_9ACTN|nr:metallophosphoesterase family protein [Aeromicrobium marinum]EFQ83063.1 Ser/Thr phosphatase family protein [Aeromicrobium marinum DSM 15272]